MARNSALRGSSSSSSSHQRLVATSGSGSTDANTHDLNELAEAACQRREQIVEERKERKRAMDAAYARERRRREKVEEETLRCKVGALTRENEKLKREEKHLLKAVVDAKVYVASIEMQREQHQQGIKGAVSAAVATATTAAAVAAASFPAALSTVAPSKQPTARWPRLLAELKQRPQHPPEVFYSHQATMYASGCRSATLPEAAAAAGVASEQPREPFTYVHGIPDLRHSGRRISLQHPLLLPHKAFLKSHPPSTAAATSLKPPPPSAPGQPEANVATFSKTGLTQEHDSRDGKLPSKPKLDGGDDDVIQGSHAGAAARLGSRKPLKKAISSCYRADGSFLPPTNNAADRAHHHLKTAPAALNIDQLRKAVLSYCVEKASAAVRAPLMEAMENALHIVHHESDPAKYVSLESGNISAAAERLMSYWQIRQELFGDRFLLPVSITGEGTLEEKDIELFKTGYLRFLPNTSTGAQAIFCRYTISGPAVTEDRDLPLRRTRCAFYALSIASQNDAPLFFLRYWDTPKWKRGPARVMVRMFAAMPLRMAGLNILFAPPAGAGRLFKDSVVPFCAEFFGRSPFEYHGDLSSSPKGFLKQLEKRGFSKHGLPAALGGTWSQDFADWFDARLRLERSACGWPEPSSWQTRSSKCKSGLPTANGNADNENNDRDPAQKASIREQGQERKRQCESQRDEERRLVSLVANADSMASAFDVQANADINTAVANVAQAPAAALTVSEEAKADVVRRLLLSQNYPQLVAPSIPHAVADRLRQQLLAEKAETAMMASLLESQLLTSNPPEVGQAARNLGSELGTSPLIQGAVRSLLQGTGQGWAPQQTGNRLNSVNPNGDYLVPQNLLNAESAHLHATDIPLSTIQRVLLEESLRRRVQGDSEGSSNSTQFMANLEAKKSR